MQLLQKLLNKFSGLHYKQDYLCLAKESFQHPLRLYIVFDDKVIKNITDQHLFIGYCPLVFSFPLSRDIDLSDTDELDIILTPKELFPNDLFSKKDAIARISLKKIRQQNRANDIIHYYEGQKGEHSFVSDFHQSVIQLHNRFYNKKTGNVYLEGNLLKQVQIAYAIPRIISLITVSDGKFYNLFPTDLHGQIDEEHYVVSLRYGGKAAQQVEMIKKILVTEITSPFHKIAYSLGKNHMMDLKTKEQFPFSDQMSATFRLAIPQSAVYYRELELRNFFNHGIHRFFLFKILNKKQIESEPLTLAHIHNVYASWRHNKGLPGNYLLR